MAAISRYRSSSGCEGEWARGSRRKVLKNLLGITRKLEMDRAEFIALEAVQMAYIRTVSSTTRFNAAFLKRMHRDWLGRIYPWAGNYRTVELVKGGFRWPPARLVPANMARFSRTTLRRFTPCQPAPLPEVARQIAIVHAEFLLVHPFRDGNGRLARWLADLMALQTGLPAPRYGFSGSGAHSKRRRYLEAVKRGYLEDYNLLAAFFEEALESALFRR